MFDEELQEWLIEVMIKSIKNRKNLFYSSEDRGVGKSYTINQLGYILQSLGYIVYILSPFESCLGYFANGRISLHSNNFRGINPIHSVILVDEEERRNMGELIDYCKDIVPIVGFVNFRKSIDKVEK